MNKLLKNKQGFSLIEVVLVLAIAGLIMVVVFLAVSNANRAARDSKRSNLAAQTLAAMESYTRNNNGAYPTATIDGYMGNILDPDTSAKPTYTVPATTVTYATSGSGIKYAGKAKCSGTGLVSGASTEAAVIYWSESGTTSVCLDNR